MQWSDTVIFDHQIGMEIPVLGIEILVLGMEIPALGMAWFQSGLGVLVLDVKLLSNFVSLLPIWYHDWSQRPHPLRGRPGVPTIPRKPSISQLSYPMHCRWWIVLAQSKFFEDEAFMNYLQYLEYFRDREYSKFIMYLYQLLSWALPADIPLPCIS